MSLRDKLQLQRLIRQVTAAGKSTPGGATAFAGLDVTAFASAATVSALSTRLDADEATLAGLPGTVNAGTLQGHPASDFATPASVAAKPDLSGATPQPVGTAVPGAGAAASRADHVHAHGDQAGGTLHAAASGAAAGFMAAADKSKIDGLSPARAAWPATPQIGADGVMEVGKFLDFHEASGNPTDFDNRLMSAGADNLQLNGKRLGTLGTTTPWTVQPGSSPGSSAEAAHADHAHGFDDTSHGSRGGGSLHAQAVAGGANGFLSGSDKTKLDALTVDGSGSLGVAGDTSAARYAMGAQAVLGPVVDRASAGGVLALAPWNAAEVQIGRSGVPAKVFCKNTNQMSSIEVAAGAWNRVAGTFSFANGTTTIVPYDNKSWDSHNAATLGTSFSYKVPITGIYLVHASVCFQSFPVGNTANAQLVIYRNGGSYSRLGDLSSIPSTGSGAYRTIIGSAVLAVNLNDTIDFRLINQSGASLYFWNDTGLSWCNITRIPGSW